MSNKIHIIFGPTASGKTEFAVKLAQNLGLNSDSVIINADSMQVYQEIPIISNQPTEQEKGEFSHKLFGYKSILEHSDLNIWLNDSIKEISMLLENKQNPILVGGTGMYLKSLIEGVSEIPKISDEVKSKIKIVTTNCDSRDLHKTLQEKDFESAQKIKPNDTQRIFRALEVFEETGVKLSEWNKKPNKKFFNEELFEIHFLEIDRDEVYKKINDRFEKFIEIGALEEAKKAKNIFDSSNLNNDIINALPAFKAHGLRELISYLNSEISLEEAIEKGQQATRNYAKRQMTWWRGWKTKING